MLILPSTQPVSFVLLEDFLCTPVTCVGWPSLWGFTESGQINLNLQVQQFTQLYCLMKRHCTLYRQLGATMWHVNSTHSSPYQLSTNAGFGIPNPSRRISYLLGQGQSSQKNIKTPTMPLSISAAIRGRTYCDAETQSWQRLSNSGPPLFKQWFAAWQQHYILYWLQTTNHDRHYILSRMVYYHLSSKWPKGSTHVLKLSA